MCASRRPTVSEVALAPAGDHRWVALDGSCEVERTRDAWGWTVYVVTARGRDPIECMSLTEALHAIEPAGGNVED